LIVLRTDWSRQQQIDKELSGGLIVLRTDWSRQQQIDKEM